MKVETGHDGSHVSATDALGVAVGTGSTVTTRGPEIGVQRCTHRLWDGPLVCVGVGEHVGHVYEASAGSDLGGYEG